MEERLAELEIKFSFQEDLLQQLNEIVIHQQQQLNEIIAQTRVLKEQLEEVSVQDSKGLGGDQAYEKPPHY